MPHFSNEEKEFFKQNGYIVKPNTVPLELIEQALEVIWQPEGQGDVLSAEELVTAYPNLKHL